MSSLEKFIDLLTGFFNKCPSGLTYGIEIRNPNYLKNAYFEFLNRLKISHIFLQGYYMPSVIDIYHSFSGYIKDTTVIRLHGSDRKGIEEIAGGNWGKVVDPRDEEISKITEIIKDLDQRKLEVYVYTNNHYEGSAPLTIAKIQKELKL